MDDWIAILLCIPLLLPPGVVLAVIVVRRVRALRDAAKRALCGARLSS